MLFMKMSTVLQAKMKGLFAGTDEYRWQPVSVRKNLKFTLKRPFMTRFSVSGGYGLPAGRWSRHSHRKDTDILAFAHRYSILVTIDLFIDHYQYLYLFTFG